ncbi:MAG: nucleoside deaminase [Eubacteriales bacterium]|nr:nucleoside deaminase [Christensenellaceae bacterium]MEA5065643.1 nucleoside deaminase [Eubacteriales bacterium]
MTLDEAMMREALREAHEALAAGELPVGAVVMRDKAIISRARNEREQTGDPTAHAEVLALRRAAEALGGWRLTGCTLYVTLEPCAMCAGAAVAARVERVVWGAPDERAGCAGSLYRLTEDAAFAHYAKSDGYVLEDECRALLDAFFGRRR